MVRGLDHLDITMVCLYVFLFYGAMQWQRLSSLWPYP